MVTLDKMNAVLAKIEFVKNKISSQNISYEELIEIVFQVWKKRGTSRDMIISKSRKIEQLFPRYISMNVLRSSFEPKVSFARIGEVFLGEGVTKDKDHASVRNSLINHDNFVETRYEKYFEYLEPFYNEFYDTMQMYGESCTTT